MTDYGILGVSSKSLFAKDKYNNEQIAEALLDPSDTSPRAVAERRRAAVINWFNYAGRDNAGGSATADSLFTTADNQVLTVDGIYA
jgi:hypothetical protein